METTQSAPEYLTHDELQRVLAVAKSQSNRNFLLLRLAYGHGLRCSEVASLTLDDVRDGMIHCARGKESVTTDEQLRDDERAALAAYLRERGDADGSCFLFTSRQGSRLSRKQVFNIFNRCAILANVGRKKHLGPHLLKHAYGTHLHQGGASPFTIMVALGHKDVRTSLRYTHVSVADAQAVSDRILGQVLAQ